MTQTAQSNARFTQGRRFWVFRAGFYEVESAPPRWYLHGLFA